MEKQQVNIEDFLLYQGFRQLEESHLYIAKITTSTTLILVDVNLNTWVESGANNSVYLGKFSIAEFKGLLNVLFKK